MLRSNVEKLREAIADDKAHAVRRCLSSADGQVLLKALESKFFDCSLVGETAEQCLVNVGAHEVVAYLRGLVRISEMVDRKKTGR